MLKHDSMADMALMYPSMVLALTCFARWHAYKISSFSVSEKRRLCLRLSEEVLRTIWDRERGA